MAETVTQITQPPEFIEAAAKPFITQLQQVTGDLKEADLTKGQIKKVHKMADELPKKDFKDRYGNKEGDAVRYATATNIVKKKEGIKEAISPDQIKRLKDSWSDLKTIPPEKVKTLRNFLDRHSTDTLMQLAQANINFVSASVFLNDINGQVFSIFILTIAAAEAAIGLAILVIYFRNKGEIDITQTNQLKD